MFFQIVWYIFLYDDFIAMEKDILGILNWELQIVTPYNLMELFLAQGIIFTSDRVMNKNSKDWISPNQQIVENAKKFAEFYAEMCLQEHSFMMYDPFTLACGIIMASRKMVRVQDKWPNELYIMTGLRKKAN